MKEVVLITDLNKEQHKELESKCKKYISNLQLLKNIEEENQTLLEELSSQNVGTVGLIDLNIKITFTPSKEVAKIDYEQTLKDKDINDYKKEKVSLVWNDTKIIDEFKENVITKLEKTKARAIITTMVK